MSSRPISRSGRKGRVFRLVVLAGWVAGALVACGPGRSGCAGPAVPGKQWERKTPESAGFSSARLDAVFQPAGGTGCIVQGGRIIYEWGDPTALNDAASSTKPMYTFLVFKGIETGRIGSLNERASDWVPELEPLNEDLGFKDRDITLHHLLSQTSGYGLEEKPGEAFAYHDFATGLLTFVLYRRMYADMPGGADAVLNGPLLGERIGFEHHPTVLHRNSKPRRIRISARDLARFALLYLRGGWWGWRRVLRKELFAKQMSFVLPREMPRTSGREAEILEGVTSFGGGRNLKNHVGCLGYYWWFNRVTPDGTRFLPDATPRTFMGLGYGGRFAMIAIPEQDLVVVWFDVYRGERWSPASEVGRFKINALIKGLMKARIRPAS